MLGVREDAKDADVHVAELAAFAQSQVLACTAKQIFVTERRQRPRRGTVIVSQKRRRRRHRQRPGPLRRQSPPPLAASLPLQLTDGQLGDPRFAEVRRLVDIDDDRRLLNTTENGT